MGRPKNHGIVAARSNNQGDPESALKRETRGSKRKAAQVDDYDENGANGMGSTSESDEPDAARSETRSPRRARRTRAVSLSEENASLIVKIPIPRSPAAAAAAAAASRTRAASAEPSGKSRSAVVAKRRRLDPPSNALSPIDDEIEDFGTVNVDAPMLASQLNSSTPTSPASPLPSKPTTPPPRSVAEGKSEWKEPQLVSFESALKEKGKFYPKLEYNMETDPAVHDELGAQRELLSEDARLDESDNVVIVPATRGRGSWRRARGGGRGRGKVMNTRDVPEDPETITMPAAGRGRGGFRVKKSANPRIQALYHRRADLRHFYRSIANIQRAALEALAEKSVELMKKDPEAHSKLPTFDKVVDGLGEAFQEVKRKVDAKLNYRRDFLNRKKRYDTQYEQIRADCAADQWEDEVAAEFYLTAEHTLKQWDIGIPPTRPFHFSENGANEVKRISKPAKHVAIEATPYFRPGDFAAQVAPYIPLYGDTETEQHPANFHLIHPTYRENLENSILTERKDNLGKKKSKSSKTLLGAASSLPAQVADTPDGDNDSLMDSDAEPAEASDAYGVKLPKKSQPKNGAAPNNRFVVDRWFDFADDEIGVRNTKTKRTNTGDAIYMGKDGNPNPKHFYFDQRANSYNSGRHKLGDLSEELIEIYNLHPQYGLPIKGCRNLNYEEYRDEFGEEAAAVVEGFLKPRTDWTQPLPPTHPVIFVEEDRKDDDTNPKPTKGDDRFKKVFRTSRSEHLLRLEQIITERPGKEKIELMLQELWEDYREVREGAFEPASIEPTPTPSPPPVTKEEEYTFEVDKESMEKFAAALTALKNEEEARLARARLAEKRTRLAFDPVRDISPPPPAPEDRTNLNVLANLAFNSRTMPPPQPLQTQYHSAYAPRAFPPPFPWAPQTHNSTPMSHSHSHPLPPPPVHPLQASLSSQPSRTQGGGSLRQLLPAPPQQGLPPPSSSSSGTVYRY